jgi:hypothetical protein
MSGAMTRRNLLEAGLCAAAGTGAVSAGATQARKRKMPDSWTALCLNEDDSHYYYSRAGQKLDAEKIASWVDQYAGTQIRELMLCPNCMRASFDSKVWDPIWKGYDPDGPDDQPLLASTNPSDRKGVRGWIHTAWHLAHEGVDVYKIWIERARHVGLSPWLTMRMNDIHNVDDEKSFIHSEFWRANPQFRRVPYRFTSWPDRAFDYGRPEVRAYHFRLIEELAERYDFDGLELDWMRFGFHFRPGREAEGAELLTQFTTDVRRLLDGWEKRRKHRIRLGARVASRPATALGLGMDAVTWAHRGLIDMLVVTPFWASIEPDMPIEIWRELLQGTRTRLAAGLELLLRPHPGFANPPYNSLETVRGAAASLLDRGADRIYLFNYFDDHAGDPDMEYATLLRECGKAQTLSGKPRRHVLTYSDTFAPGEPSASALPVSCSPGQWRAFRLPTGPKPSGGRVEARFGIQGATESDVRGWEVRLNGAPCSFTGRISLTKPVVNLPAFAFEAPVGAMERGYNLLELLPAGAGQIEWVEIAAL